MNDSSLARTLEHLRVLVGFDTQNPPRRIDPNGIHAYLRDQLEGFDCQITDYGDGCITLLAERGRPDTLFNFHLDTVPASSDWSGDPLELKVDGESAVGLGACDIKGASACMLSAAQETRGDLALLFSSDEEAGSNRCIHGFLATKPRHRRVVVAEPTECRAVLAHRGVLSVRVCFFGEPGHSSAARALEGNAIHRAAHWLSQLCRYAESREDLAYQNLKGLRLNVGTVRGGIKNNIIAPECEVGFGMRLIPGQSREQLTRDLKTLPGGELIGDWQVTFSGPSLPCETSFSEGPEPETSSVTFASELGLEVAEPVDFWTEAALFSAAEMPALVFGPGNIAQAHTAGEWVALEQLQRAAAAYTRMIDGGL